MPAGLPLLKALPRKRCRTPFSFLRVRGIFLHRNQEPDETAPGLPGLSRIWRINYLTPDAADNDNRFSRGNQAGFLFVLFISESAGACSLQKKKIIETEIL